MSEVDNALVPEDDFSLIPAIPRERLNLDRAIELPIDDLASLGVGLASLPEPFRTATIKIASHVDGLFRVTDASGKPLSEQLLFKFKDGSGNLAAFKDASGLHQTRLNKAGDVVQTIATKVPYDPTLMFVAVALMEVNRKLDEIKDVVQDILDYLKIHDHAELKAGFEALDEIRRDYMFNSKNKAWLSERQITVGRIREKARVQINQHAELLEGKLKKFDGFHLMMDEKKSSETAQTLKDYQTACCLFAYATIENVLLMQTFDAGYLEGIASDLHKYAVDYKERYDRCIDAVQAYARDAIGAQVAGAVGTAANWLGGAVKATPVGDATPLDEGLEDLGNSLKGVGLNDANCEVKKLAFGHPSFMDSFIEAVEDINHRHNEPQVIAMGDGAVYILPAEDVLGGKV